jgi:hypothetical protein
MNKPKNRSIDGELLTYQQTAEKSNLGVGTVMKLTRESDSLVKIGRTARVNWEKFYQYLLTVYTVCD